MKQKIIYSVLIAAAVYLPAFSKECAGIVRTITAGGLPVVKQDPVLETENISVSAVSPLKRLLINL